MKIDAENIKLGMTWWNGLTRFERATVLAEADSVRGWDGRDLAKASAPADAWELWRSGKIRMDVAPAIDAHQARPSTGRTSAGCLRDAGT